MRFNGVWCWGRAGPAQRHSKPPLEVPCLFSECMAFFFFAGLQGRHPAGRKFISERWQHPRLSGGRAEEQAHG